MEMTEAQIGEFLRAPRNAIVGTNSVSGAPQLSPVWYEYEAGRLYIITSVETAKYRNLKRDPRISVCIDAGHPDSRTVIAYGTTTLLEASDPLVEQMRWRIIEHYYEREEEARVYFESTKSLHWALIVVTPQKIITQDFNSSV